MKQPVLTELIQRALQALEESREELRQLDAAIGDGDLGITVGEGARAVREALAGGAGGDSPASLLRASAQKFATANPSTMAALVSAGLLAAAKSVATVEELGRTEVLAAIQAAATVIEQRGGAGLGDKTVLDALLPSIDALRAAGRDDVQALRDMIAAAQNGVRLTQGLQSQRGRAAWVGERSIGQADGGAVAYLRFLQAIEREWPVAPTAAATDGADPLRTPEGE
jgi:phosphoenolpyruvate---glycerone phosphotransferase subunit DhaL